MRAVGAAGYALALCFAACGKSGAPSDAGRGPTAVAPSSEMARVAPRPGMVWIEAGTLRAGSAPYELPRVAEAELPGVDVPMSGFYIDLLPWPNEMRAIPTTDVTRGEAIRLCETKGKRLCSELEWERACKGPDNARYEYGSVYDSLTCGTGLPAEISARRPSGERASCRSAFGVHDMHGGALEWTDSHWGRGSRRDVGVVRGGNDLAAEVAARCAFARPLAPTARSPVTGFRCCAGPRNEAEVQLEITAGAPFERAVNASLPSPPLDALDGAACGPPAAPAPCSSSRAWTWRPVPNTELSLAGGCLGRPPDTRCALAVARTAGDRVESLAQIDTGREAPEVVLVVGPERRIRVRGLDRRGHFFRDVVYRYGTVDVHEVN